MSGYPAELSARRSIDEGADAYLDKMEAVNLASAIREVLSKKR